VCLGKSLAELQNAMDNMKPVKFPFPPLFE
jgi:hypothetical protein